MTASLGFQGTSGIDRRMGYQGPVPGYEVLVTTPRLDPERWREFLEGATRSYRAHRVEEVLDLDRMRDGRSTSLLFVLLSPVGETVAGIRVQGPYCRPEDSHVVSEWEGSPDQPVVHAMLEQRLPEGVVEMKAAWVGEGVLARRQVVAWLSRTPLHAATVLGTRYAMGSAAAHSVAGWVSAGAVLADVEAVPYPTEHYSTRLAWFDRKMYTLPSDQDHRRVVEGEIAQLRASALPVQTTR